MAADRYTQEYPPQGRSGERRSATTSHYPHHHSPGDSQRSQEAPREAMAASVSLPSIHDPRVSNYGPPLPQHPHLQPQAHHQQALPTRGYPTDPRYASPNTINGYPSPAGQQPPPQQQQPPPQHQLPQTPGYLPPVHHQQHDPRSAGYPPPQDPRGGYYDDRRPQYQHEQYAPESYYYRGPPPPGPPPNGYPRDYRGPPPGPYAEYPQGPGNAQPITQAAPRQRTSIACRYCRKRKIRCSGFHSAPGGKCQNCARMNQECIFQPVSSSSSAAFIPVSAVPGGVPPGTPLYGAYGQPLTPSTGQPPPHHYPLPPGGPPMPPANYYQQQPMHSPTESYSSYGDSRADESQIVGRRRRRTPEELEDEYRHPPPRSAGPDEDPRRRSPAAFSNNSSPGGLSYPTPHQGARHSPRSATLQQPPAPHGGQYAHGGPPGGGRSPAPQSGSSGASTPARPGQPPTSQPQQGNSSVMNLSNLVEKNDIDRTMIDRLNRTREPSASASGGKKKGSR